MYKGKKIGLIVVFYNEERLIIPTLKGVPSYVDRIYAIDDASTDKTCDLIKDYSEKYDNRIILIHHEKNRGVGQAVITGYLAASKDKMDIVAGVGGDHQFDLQELPFLLDPIVEGKADYTKGNRFLVDAKYVMPIKRYLGNILLSIMTRWSSGRRDIFDTQDGFTAISKTAIDIIDWVEFWKGYGYPSDFIVRIAAYGFRIMDVPRRTIYLPGEKQSQIKIKKYIKTVAPMIIHDFFWRLKNQKRLNEKRIKILGETGV